MLKCPKKRREAAAAEAAAAATATDKPSAELDSPQASSRVAPKETGLTVVDDDGELAETGSNGFAAYLRASMGNLASDSAYVTMTAVASAAQALSRVSS